MRLTEDVLVSELLSFMDLTSPENFFLSPGGGGVFPRPGQHHPQGGFAGGFEMFTQHPVDRILESIAPSPAS